MDHGELLINVLCVLLVSSGPSMLATTVPLFSHPCPGLSIRGLFVVVVVVSVWWAREGGGCGVLVWGNLAVWCVAGCPARDPAVGVCGIAELVTSPMSKPYKSN